MKLCIFDNVTALQPRCILFWDMAAWHMAYNASVAAMRTETSRARRCASRPSANIRSSGEDYLLRGIANNPDRSLLYDRLGFLYRDKFHDHCKAAELYAEAAAQCRMRPATPTVLPSTNSPSAPATSGRPTSGCSRSTDGRSRNGCPPCLNRLKYLQEKLNIPAAEQIHSYHSSGSANHPDDAFCHFRRHPRQPRGAAGRAGRCREARGARTTSASATSSATTPTRTSAWRSSASSECPVVKGNHDEQASIEPDLEGFNPLAEEAINWTRATPHRGGQAMAARSAGWCARCAISPSSTPRSIPRTSGATSSTSSTPPRASTTSTRSSAFTATPTRRAPTSATAR